MGIHDRGYQMLEAVAGIRVYFNNGITNESLSLQGGVLRYTEAEVTIAEHYSADALLEGWDSGCSNINDLRTHIRPQSFSGGSIVIDNSDDKYNMLLAYESDFDGKKIERVHYTTTGIEIVSTHIIKKVSPETSRITLELGSIVESQKAEVSKPISGETYYPVIFGAHEYGVYQPEQNQFTNATVNGVDVELVVYRVGSWLNNTVRFEVFPYNYSISPTDLYDELGGTGENDLYIKFTSGAGAGDVLRLVSDNATFDQFSMNTTDKVAYLYTNRTFTDEVGDYTYKSIDSESGEFTVDVSRGVVVRGNNIYTTDEYSGFVPDLTDFTVYNKEKIGNSVDYNKTTNKITLSSPIIQGDFVTTANALPAESVEIVTDLEPSDFGISGTWVNNASGLWVDSALVNVTKTGTEADVIDRSGVTELSFKIDIDSPSQAGVLILKTKLTSENIDSLLIDATTTAIATSGEVGTIRNNVYFYSGGGKSDDWQSSFLYSEALNNVIEEDLVGAGETEVNAIQSDIHDSFYGTVNTWNREYYSNTDFSFVSGSTKNFSYDGKLRRAITSDNVEGIDNYIVIYFSGGFTSSNPTNTTTLSIKSIGGYYAGQGSNLSDAVFSPVNGRPYTTFSSAIQHVLKLRNWSVSGVTQPSEGWGFGEASITITDNANNTTPVRAQIVDKNMMNTYSLLESLAIESWDMIHFDKDDTPIISDVLSTLGVDTSTHSFSDLAPSEVRILENYTFEDKDIFNTFNIEYDYDAPTNTYLKSISVSNVSADAYDESYTSGITDGVEASELWEDCNTLFKKAEQERTLPDQRSKLKWIYTEADALQYIKNCIKFYGINRDLSSVVGLYMETRRVVAEHDIRDFYIVAEGDSIEYEIANVTFGLPYSGFVTGVKYDPSTKKCQISSIIRQQVVVGNIIESGAQPDNVIESGDRTDNVIEVGV
jgi:hypothetical protein